MFRKIYIILAAQGIDLKRFFYSLLGVPGYFRDVAKYTRLSKSSPFPLQLRSILPILADSRLQAGNVSGHYFLMDLWAARLIFERRPAEHVDVGSRIDGFVAHLLCFMPVKIVDIRPLAEKIDGLSFICDDATSLPTIPSESVPSLSCLHAAEHFGLGRYGDAVDPDACFKLMSSLQRVLAPGGDLYLAVPVGKERVEFNAHRIFSPHTIIKALHKLNLKEFSIIDDTGRFIVQADPTKFSDASYACGLFHFSK